MFIIKRTLCRPRYHQASKKERMRYLHEIINSETFVFIVAIGMLTGGVAIATTGIYLLAYLLTWVLPLD